MATRIDTFRRAMRRHVKRARALGLSGPALTLQAVRDRRCPLSDGWRMRSAADYVRRRKGSDFARRTSFLYSLAADALAKLGAAAP